MVNGNGCEADGGPHRSSPCPRAILHIDMDCFYAQVEHNRLSIPRDEPLAVVQWAGLIAVNYAARKAGISRHDNAKSALQKCPKLRLVHVEYIGADGPTAEGSTPASASQQIIGAPADSRTVKACLDRYRKVSAAIFAVLKRFCSVCEKGSLDEAYLDVSSEVHAEIQKQQPQQQQRDRLLAQDTSWEGHVYSGEADGEASSQSQPAVQSLEDRYLFHASALAAKIRAAVADQCGITCSAGVAHNKLLAKLASAMHKPNGQTVLLSRGVFGLLAPLPLRKIRGMGGKLGDQLEAVGISTAGQVMQV
eukprot:SAG31_NODE_7701_length_1613_cov_2.061427_1_plen_306_part_00